MRVYHFRDEIFGLKSLKERRLKIARIMELNDPFEFLAAELTDKKLRRALQNTKAELSKTKGILCFSNNWSNPVQWSHYANHHKGICLCFDIPTELLTEVRYVKNRITMSGIIDYKLMQRILTTKFEHWHYEEEYRLFISLDPTTEENGLYFSDFSNELQLKKVIVGGRSEITRSKLNGALGKLADQVEVFTARPAFKTFSVVRNKNEALWA